MSNERFIATVEKMKVQEVADALRTLGFRIDSVLRLGIIIGALNGMGMDRIRKVNGVKTVEREKSNHAI
jgi:hypothetical protein